MCHFSLIDANHNHLFLVQIDRVSKEEAFCDSMSATGQATVDAILAQPGKGMAAHDRVIPQVEQEEYE